MSSQEVSRSKVLEFCPPNDDNTNDKKMARIKSDISYWNALYFVVVLASSILITSILTLIPRHNSVLYPIYWYEVAIMYILVVAANTTFTHILELYIYLNVTELACIKMGLGYFMKALLVVGIPYLSIYLIWTIILGNSYPMPFFVMATFMTSWVFYFVLIWIAIPSDLRKEKVVRMKIKAYFLYQCMWIVIQFQLTALTQIFQMLSAGLRPQWIMALLIPSFRALNYKILGKLVYKMTGSCNKLADILLSTSVDMYFGLYVAILLASASDFTVYCILGVDLFLHFRSCFQIARLQHRIQANEGETEAMKNNMDKDVEDLILSEVIEGLIPISYAANFATAYYGPNATLIGNVRSNYFDFKEIEDVDNVFISMIQLFTVDVCCILVTAITLWFSGKRNILKEFCKIMKKYWIILAIKLAGGFFTTFAQNDVNVGMDTTFKFEWITKEGRIRFIQNATDISTIEKSFLLKNNSLI